MFGFPTGQTPKSRRARALGFLAAAVGTTTLFTLGTPELLLPKGASAASAATVIAERRPADLATVHVVASGESLSSLAAKYGIGRSRLANLNKLPADAHLRIGQRLAVPALIDLPGSSPKLPARLRADAQRLKVRAYAKKWANRNGIPVDLLEATMWLESGYNQSKVSKKGAIGVGQLMPGTAAFIETHLIGVDLDPRNTEHNVRMSARYLWYLLKMHDGDSTKALHAYYQGASSVRERGLYDDTIAYARNVQALRKRFR